MKRRFDWIIDPQTPRPKNFWDVEFFGNDQFSVVPSLGSLVPGWLLVIPRRLSLNLKDLGEENRTSLPSLLTEIGKALPRNTTIFQFEHGSTSHGSAMGCGIDQAHLHVVPLHFNLLDAALQKADENISWSRSQNCADPWKSLQSRDEYILIRGGGRLLIGTVKRPISQWVRRLIADVMGCSTSWDYKSHPGLDNIRQTYAMARR